MQKFTPQKISWLIGAIFLVGCFLILSNFWNRLAFPMDYRFFDDDGNENLSPGQPIVETFAAQDNNLAQVNILMGNLEKIQAGEKLIVSILDEKL
jgi:hypothetical protein